MLSSPKIQRLVTPLRLQRRRHLLAVKKRKIDHQKEQKAEYEYVQTSLRPFIIFIFFLPTSVSSSLSVLPIKKPRLPPSKHRTRKAHNSSTLRPVSREALLVAKHTSWIGSGLALGIFYIITLLSVDPVVQVTRFVCYLMLFHSDICLLMTLSQPYTHKFH